MVVSAVLVSVGATAADEWSGPCRGECLNRAEKLLLNSDSQSLVAAVRSASELAARECKESPTDQAACGLAARLRAGLGEYDATSKRDPRLAERDLRGRQCIDALSAQLAEPDDWATMVTLWCDHVFDACDPGLMVVAGHVPPALRTELIGGACADSVCPKLSGSRPAICSAAPAAPPVATRSDVLALLPHVFARTYSPEVSAALVAAFEKPTQPFFGEPPPPKAPAPKRPAAPSRAKPH